MTTFTTNGQIPVSIHATDPLAPAVAPYARGQLETTQIPIDLPTDTFRTLYRVVLGGVEPGDTLKISADARVTNNVGYNVGVGWHVWMYDYNTRADPENPWWRISAFSGENVTPDMHHMPLHISPVYRMPADWTPGHRPVIVMRADAHSTAWKSGHTLLVDAGYGQLSVERWTAPQPPVPAA